MASAEPVVVVGAGLAGLVATFELTRRKVPVILVDQESEANLGGQAFWSLGGIFCVNSKGQRKVGIKDSKELAMADWFNTAKFDKPRDDYWPAKWAEAFVNFAAEDMEEYLNARGLVFSNAVSWNERGDGRADGHGNSVPRFHMTWGTGPELVRVFAEPVKKAAKEGLVTFRWRHQVDDIVTDSTGRAVGVKGKILEPSNADRGVSSSRNAVSDFQLSGHTVLITSGGVGGNLKKVRENWPKDMGPPPERLLTGVPAHVDGRLQEIVNDKGGNLINTDRMWVYVDGIKNWDPIWPGHGIRVAPGPSSLWFDAEGTRLPPSLYPGSDTRKALKHIRAKGHDYSWFILDKTTITREFALSGSEQNPDLTSKKRFLVFSRVFGKDGTGHLQNHMKRGEDFVVKDDLQALVVGMNEVAAKTGGPQLEYEKIKRQIDLVNMQRDNPFCKDGQLMLQANARSYWLDKWTRMAPAHKLGDPKHGPFVAVRMNLLTRKTLGGLETDLTGAIVRPDGSRFSGLFAAGEAAGFGGGGVHGYNALEGTFLGGCVFTGRNVGRAIADMHPAAKSIPQARL